MALSPIIKWTKEKRNSLRLKSFKHSGFLKHSEASCHSPNKPRQQKAGPQAQLGSKKPGAIHTQIFIYLPNNYLSWATTEAGSSAQLTYQ